MKISKADCLPIENELEEKVDITWHQTTFLQPENGSKTSREENSFNSCKCYHSFSICGIFSVDPFQSLKCNQTVVFTIDFTIFCVKLAD